METMVSFYLSENTMQFSKCNHFFVFHFVELVWDVGEMWSPTLDRLRATGLASQEDVKQRTKIGVEVDVKSRMR